MLPIPNIYVFSLLHCMVVSRHVGLKKMPNPFSGCRHLWPPHKNGRIHHILFWKNLLHNIKHIKWDLCNKSRHMSRIHVFCIMDKLCNIHLSFHLA